MTLFYNMQQNTRASELLETALPPAFDKHQSVPPVQARAIFHPRVFGKCERTRQTSGRNGAV